MIEQNRHDRDRLNELLINHNIKMVYSLAKNYSSKVSDFDNLIQDGMRGLSEAAQKFDIDHGTKFITYAVPWILKYMKQYFYHKNVEIERNSVSLNGVIQPAKQHDDSNGITFENYVNDFMDPSLCRSETVSSQLSVHEQENICENLYDALDRDDSISAMDKKIFKDMFVKQEKSKDLMLKYNIDSKTISDIKSKILSKFKNILVNE